MVTFICYALAGITALVAAFLAAYYHGVNSCRRQVEALNAMVNVLKFYDQQSSVLKEVRQAARTDQNNNIDTYDIKLGDLLMELVIRINSARRNAATSCEHLVDIKKVLKGYKELSEAELEQEKLDVLVALVLHRKNAEISRLNSGLLAGANKEEQLKVMVAELDRVLNSSSLV